MFDEAAKGKPKGLLKTLLTFLLFYIIASFVEIIIPTAVAFIDGIRLAAQGANDAELSDNLWCNYSCLIYLQVKWGLVLFTQ